MGYSVFASKVQEKLQSLYSSLAIIFQYYHNNITLLLRVPMILSVLFLPLLKGSQKVKPNTVIAKALKALCDNG